MAQQTVVITGASRGIGEAVARRFGNAGEHLILCARDEEPLQSVAAAIREDGGTVTAVRADVRDEFDVERLVERAASEGGAIDLVLANAGVYHGSPGETLLSQESYAAFDDHLRTNARGVFATIREALPHLSPDARLLVSSGVVARDHRTGYGSYAVSKSAAEAVAMGFAEAVEHPIGVVDPGQVATSLTDGQGTDPADAAEQFYWAATEAAPDTVDGAIVDRQTWRESTG